MTGGKHGGKLSRRDVLRRAGLATAGTLAGGVALNAASPRLWPETPFVDPNRSYWARVLPAERSPLVTDTDADVAVIGGGLTGLSTAYFLRRLAPGLRVVLLEARRCGNGASARNGAMLLTSTAERWLVPGAEPELDRRLYELTAANIGMLRLLSEQFGVDIELEVGGAAQVLRSDAELRRAQDAVARLRDRGVPAELWNAETVRDRLGTGLYRGAVLDPASGQLHPGRLVTLFRTAAESAGAEIHEGTRVDAIEEGPVHTILTRAGRRVRAPLLVLATNAYSSKLGYLRNAYAPVASYVAVTAPLDEATVDRIGWRNRVPFTDNRLEPYYLGMSRDRRLHIGGGPARYGFHETAPPAAVEGLHRAALVDELARVYPALGPVGFDACWSGAVDMSLDEAPAVGRTGRHGNVYYAIGFSGHGVNLTSVFGRVIAELIAGQPEAWSWLPYLNRLPPYLPNDPFRWLGIRAAQAATRLVQR